MDDSKRGTLKREFHETLSTEAKQDQKQDEKHEVPEAIKKHAPALELKPKGGWRKAADAVDRRIAEGTESRKAKYKWAKKMNKTLRHGQGFNRGGYDAKE